MHFNSTKQERMIFRESYTVLVAFLETISHCLLIEFQSCWCFKSNLVMIMFFFGGSHSILYFKIPIFSGIPPIYWLYMPISAWLNHVKLIMFDREHLISDG